MTAKKFTILTLLISIIFSCSNDKKENSTENVKEATSNSNRIENSIEEEKIEPANLTCKLFFKGSDIEEEDGSISKGRVNERDEFKTKKTYTFCYDSESFNSIKIEGSGKQISILIKEGNSTIYKKENIDIEGAYIISSKDVMINGGDLKYTISITQEGNNIFTGKIDSQGCM